MNNLGKSLLLLLIIVAFALIYAMQLEVVPVNNGLGWDGVDYVQFMNGFAAKIFDKLIPKHYILRFGYLGWGSIMLHFFGNDNIVFCAQITNILLIIGTFLVFQQICRKLLFTKRQFTLGIILLFFNFANLKFPLYLPVLSDTFGFFIGMLTTYFYLKGNRLGFWWSIIIGIGFFPTVIFYPILLLFDSDVSNAFKAKNSLLRWIPTFGFALLFSVLVFVLGDRFLNMQTSQVTPITKSWLWLAVPIVLFYLWCVADIISTNFSIKNIFKSLNIKHLMIFVLIAAVLKVIQNYFGNSEVEILGGVKFVINIVKHSIQVPAGFLVAHAMFFGVLPIYLSIRHWSQLKACILNLPLGEKWLIFLIFILVLNSESRQLINLYPFFIVTLLIAIQKVDLSSFEIFCYALLSLFQSGFWFRINLPDTAQFGAQLQQPAAQRFFRFMGPWVSEQAYVENLSIVVCLILLLVFVSKLNKTIIPKTKFFH